MAYNPYAAVKTLKVHTYRCVVCQRSWGEQHFGASIAPEHQKCPIHDSIGYAMRQCRVEFYRLGHAPDPDATARALKAVREAIRFRRETVKGSGRPELRRAIIRVANAEGRVATQTALRDLAAVAEEWAAMLEVSPGKVAAAERGIQNSIEESLTA